MLRIQLLGPFHATRNGQEIKIPSAKQVALLAYLATEAPLLQPRQRLQDLLWGRRFEAQARQSLRQAVSKLRSTIGFDLIVVEGEAIGLSQTGWESDLREFKAKEAEQTLEASSESIELWRGEMLTGITVSEPAFESWLEAKRREIRETVVDAMRDLSEQALQQGAVDRSLAMARRAIDLEQYRDDLRRLVMTSLDRLDRRVEALRYFEEYQRLLQNELGTRPDSETIALAEILRKARAGSAVTPRPTVNDALLDFSRDDEVWRVDGLSNQPGIAVLPFANISGDQEEQFFADGIAGDIIIALSRFRWLKTIARNSSFTFREGKLTTREIARELGVDYILEGSVRSSGKRIRVTAQLVDASSNVQLWAERYDGELNDIFDLQDEITQRVTASLHPELEKAEWQRLQASRASNLNAWQLCLKGIWHFYKHTADDQREACKWLERAIASDPNYCRAYAALAYVKFHQVSDGNAGNPKELLSESYRLAQNAVALDDQDAFAHLVLGRVYSVRFQYEQAISELEFARRLNPGLADVYHALAFTFAYGGQPDKAIPLFEKAYALSPHDANVWAFFGIRAAAYIELKQYDEAIRFGREAVQKRYAKYWAFSHLASALGHGGVEEEAQRTVSELLSRNPSFSIEFARERLYYYKESDALEHYLEGLRKAGVPES